VNKEKIGPELFRVVNVGKYYPATQTHALRDVSLSVTRGEFVGIRGPSGSGKSTLLYLLSGLLTPTSGKIYFNEQPLKRIRNKALYRRSYLGFVFQDFYLYPGFTTIENVLFPSLYRLFVPPQMCKKAEGLLKELHIYQKKGVPVESLSAGERQRVCIARALLNDPQCILADEPTGNLDSHNGQIILEMLKKINNERQTTIVLVTHEERVSRYAHRIIHMSDGKVANAHPLG
jgi:putative ABC transport system ATP-binding protein